MVKSLDGLVTYLLDEIAHLGEQGASRSEVERHVREYYGRSQAGEGEEHVRSSPEQVASHAEIGVAFLKPSFNAVSENFPSDALFVDRIWSWLEQHPEIEVFRDVAVSNATIVDRSDATQSPTRAAKRLRVNEERMWLALTGHGKDLGRCPRLEFSLLSHIASRREYGISQTELIKVAVQDKRSLPKRTEALHRKGYIVKKPIFVRGLRTSLLVLQKFAHTKASSVGYREAGQAGGEIDASAWTGNEIDFHALTSALFEQIRIRRLMTLDDLKHELGIFHLPWHSRVFSRFIRQFENLGCLQRVRAASDHSKPNSTHRCIKYIKDPSAEEWDRSLDVDLVKYEEPMEEEAGDGPETKFLSNEENNENDFPAKSEVHPAWDPDRVFVNLIFDIIKEAGVEGINTMSLCSRTSGDLFQRPFTTTMERLTEDWELTQPTHLRHLAVLKDAGQSSRTSFYQYYSFENFQHLVERGNASWESVISTNNKKQKHQNANSTAECEKDEFGFPAVPVRDSRQMAKGGLRGKMLAESVEDIFLTANDPILIHEKNGERVIEWPEEGRGHRKVVSMHVSLKNSASPLDRPRKQLGRPRKYAKGEEPYKPEVKARLKREKEEQIKVRAQMKAEAKDSVSQKRARHDEASVDESSKRQKVQESNAMIGELPSRTTRSQRKTLDTNDSANTSMNVSPWMKPFSAAKRGEITPAPENSSKGEEVQAPLENTTLKHGSLDSHSVKGHETIRKDQGLRGSVQPTKRGRGRPKKTPIVEADFNPANGGEQDSRNDALLSASQTVDWPSEHPGSRRSARLAPDTDHVLQRRGNNDPTTHADMQKLPNFGSGSMDISSLQKNELDKNSMLKSRKINSVLEQPESNPQIELSASTPSSAKRSFNTYDKKSVSLRRKKIISKILNSYGGSFPGDRELWYMFSHLWLKETKEMGRPDPRTIRNMQKYMVDNGDLVSIVFAFRNSKGLLIQKTILVQKDRSIDSPDIALWKEKLMSVDGEVYIPPESGLSSTERKFLDSSQIRSKGPNTRDLPVAHEKVELLNIPVRALSSSLRRQRRIAFQSALGEDEIAEQTRLKEQLSREYVQLNEDEQRQATRQIRNAARFSNTRLLSSGKDSRISRLHGVREPSKSIARGIRAKWRTMPSATPTMQGLICRMAFHPSSGTFGSLNSYTQTNARGRYNAKRKSPSPISAIVGQEPGRERFNHFHDTIQSVTPRKTKKPRGSADTEPLFLTSQKAEGQLAPNRRGPSQLSSSAARHAGMSTSSARKGDLSKVRLDADNLRPAKGPESSTNLIERFKTRRLTAAPRKGSPLKQKRLSSFDNQIPHDLRSSSNDEDELADLDESAVDALHSRSMSDDEVQRLIIATIAVRTLTGGRDRHIDWIVVAKVFPKFGYGELQARWNSILMKHRLQVEKLQADFQEAFLTAYEAGQVPLIDYDDLIGYDWNGLVDWMESSLDTPDVQKIPQLPKDRNYLAKLFDIRNMEEERSHWRKEYFDTQTAMYRRTNLAFSDPMNVTFKGNENRWEESNKELLAARSCVRANILTPKERYDAEAAKQRLSALGADMVGDALDELLADQVVLHANKGRAMPGRNYDVTEAFMSSMKQQFEEKDFREAAGYKSTLDSAFNKQGKASFPEDVQDMQVLITMNMLAHGRIKLVALDPPNNPMGLLDGSYKTRLMDRSRLHFGMELQPTASYEFDNVLEPLLTTDPPRPKTKDLIPIWYDIHDNVIGKLLLRCVSAVLSLAAMRPGISVSQLSGELKPGLEEWELRLLIPWLESVRALKGVTDPTTHVTNNIANDAGCSVGEWWWLVVDAIGKRYGV